MKQKAQRSNGISTKLLGQPILIKADPEFERILKNIKIRRIQLGKDRKFKSTSRLTLAMTRHRLFPDIVSDVERADLP